ncbi:transcriptional regulator with XRE-family HTH domain [Pseudochelatococcus contaminans]|uniref:Transcriptional regulator with XRE-family HTH domain n=2 Tax=Pseudochelatococcus contaminans TaxID=1538103 RepID=A0A7W5Z797_9HYPH|nr:transcriptional regulator with XRE-family HTH domain [Pseudochelatococcus contaminans]
MITPTQSKMARAALDWSIRDLARQAAVGVSTVTRFENGQGEPIPATVQAIKLALEAEGIRFTEHGVEMPALGGNDE